MQSNAILPALLDHVQAELPHIARHVVDSVSNTLKSNPRHFALQDPWGRRRHRFALEFETEMRPKLAKLRQGLRVGTRAGNLDDLSLVDEHQALRDVGIAHAVEISSEASRQELFQLRNFFRALDTQTPSGRDPNPLRPGFFARALSLALEGPDLGAEGHYALMRVAAPALSEALVPLYRTLCQMLRQHQLLPDDHATDAGSGRPIGPITQAGQLADLRARAKATARARQQAEHPDDLGLDSRLPDDLATAMVERLFERILTDARVADSVKPVLIPLRTAVAQLATRDESLLAREDHPAWRLVNALSAYGSGLASTRDPRLADFLSFVHTQGQALQALPQLDLDHFIQFQVQLDALIARQARERSEPSRGALEALTRESQRSIWENLLREQLREQFESMPVHKLVRHFLLGHWCAAVVQAMVQNGPNSAAAHEMALLVDPLIESFSRGSQPEDQASLRHELPALALRVGEALTHAKVAESQRKALLDDLMKLHAQALLGHLAETSQPTELGRLHPGLGALTQAAPASSTHAHTEAGVPLSPEESMHALLQARDEEYGSRWAHEQVELGDLPTEPMPLYGDGATTREEAINAWIDGLGLGEWLHLNLGDQWLTAQLVWISEERQFFLLVGQDADERHPLTAGALRKLYENGFVAHLESDGAVQRAVSTLMQDEDL